MIRRIAFALCLVLAGCTVTDPDTGAVIVRSKASPALPVYYSLPTTTYTTGGGFLDRVRIEADKVTCYRMSAGVSCLRDAATAEGIR